MDGYEDDDEISILLSQRFARPDLGINRFVVYLKIFLEKEIVRYLSRKKIAKFIYLPYCTNMDVRIWNCFKVISLRQCKLRFRLTGYF